ncbi:hypothetical protein D3C80_1882770 [compost metagenome]
METELEAEEVVVLLTGVLEEEACLVILTSLDSTLAFVVSSDTADFTGNIFLIVRVANGLLLNS